MRPRINSFGQITRKELDKYFWENQVYGFTAKVNDKTIIYSYNMMFRRNYERPEMLFVEVSKTSKLVLKVWSDNSKSFKNIDELKNYTKINKKEFKY